MKFEREVIDELKVGYTFDGEYEIVSDVLIDHTRWHVWHRMVFKVVATGKYYEHEYSVGATEMQDSYDAWDDGEGMVECNQVVPVERTIIVYV